MNKTQLKSIYQKVQKTRNEPNDNRYAKIHVLFHELALLKIEPETQNEKKKENWSGAVGRSLKAAKKTKQFWKDFFGINSLKDLSNERLHEIEDFLEKKIQYEYDRKFSV